MVTYNENIQKIRRKDDILFCFKKLTSRLGIYAPANDSVHAGTLYTV